MLSLVLALGCTALAVVLGSAAGRPKAIDLEVLPLPVKVLRAEESSSFRQRQVYTGQVASRRRSELSFDRPGRVMELGPYAGELVEAGQVVARQDDRELQAEQAREQARLAAAEALLAELVAGPRTEVIDAAAAELAALDADLKLASWRAEQRSALSGTRAMSEEEVLTAQTLTSSLTAKRQAAAARLAELQRGTRPEQIAAQRAAVNLHQKELARIAVLIDHATLRAPFTGRIVERRLDEGAVALPGAPVLSIVESGMLEIRVGVPERFAPSDGAKISVSIGGQEVPARLARRGATLDAATRQRVLIFELQDPGQAIPQQIARVAIEDEIAERGIWLPRTALRKDVRGLFAVAVVAGAEAQGVVETRAVSIEHTDGDRVYVRGTLRPLERVIVAGQDRVVIGQRVLALESGL